VSRGRRVEFTDFVAARRAQLRHFAYGLCGSWDAADDLVQTALVKLYVAWPRVHKRGAEEAYARRIITRAAIDESRRPWRRESPGLEGFDHPGPPGSDADDRQDLVVALSQLPLMQRKTVVLRHWIGLSVTETAVELGLSEGTVKSHTSRALERLHTLMSTEEGRSR
jgi:RNA polymerase sigma-70 factor (sigma-E family)